MNDKIEHNMDKINALPSFKPSDYLKTTRSMVTYLNDLLEDGDASLIAAALGEICQAKGLTEIAEKTGVRREALYKALRNAPDTKPRMETIIKVLGALDLRLAVVSVKTKKT